MWSGGRSSCIGEDIAFGGYLRARTSSELWQLVSFCEIVRATALSGTLCVGICGQEHCVGEVAGRILFVSLCLASAVSRMHTFLEFHAWRH